MNDCPRHIRGTVEIINQSVPAGEEGVVTCGLESRENRLFQTCSIWKFSRGLSGAALAPPLSLQRRGGNNCPFPGKNIFTRAI